MKSILTIAGSDPSGGAGIQADLKTFAVLGCYGAAAITAVTCQNTLGVSRCVPLPADLITDQVAAVLSDIAPSHIKIGMTATAEIIAALAAELKSFKGEIILDPVLKSSSGRQLLDADPSTALAPLLRRVTVLTPNIPELASLSQHPISTEAEAVQAGRQLMARYTNIKALCIKGGHLAQQESEVVDILLSRGPHVIRKKSTRHPRRRTANSHGTGCTFASALAAYHAATACYLKAFPAAVCFVDTLLACSSRTTIGRGTGPLLHHRWPEIEGGGRRKHGAC